MVHLASINIFLYTMFSTLHSDHIKAPIDQSHTVKNWSIMAGFKLSTAVIHILVFGTSAIIDQQLVAML